MPGMPKTKSTLVYTQRRVAVLHGQVGIFSLGWYTSYRSCLDKNTGGCATLNLLILKTGV